MRASGILRLEALPMVGIYRHDTSKEMLLWWFTPDLQKTISYILGVALLLVYVFNPELREPGWLGVIILLLGLPKAIDIDLRRNGHSRTPSELPKDNNSTVNGPDSGNTPTTDGVGK